MTKKEKKAAYDREYRRKNLAMLKAKKKAAYAKWGPKHRELERKRRKVKAKEHVKYCRQPEYKAWKKKYDKDHRDKRYGDYRQALVLLRELQREIRKQMPDRFERYAQAQRHQWNPLNQQRRKKRYGNFDFNFDSF